LLAHLIRPAASELRSRSSLQRPAARGPGRAAPPDLTGHAGKTLELPELASPGPDALAFQLGVAPSLASDSTIALARNKAPVSYAPAALYSGPPADSASMPPQNRSKVPTGTILEGKFRVTKEIGRGGMAAVYEAENID